MCRKVELVPYTSQWREDFNRLVAFLRQHPALTEVLVEHIGSTSVEGLPAKPIIDLDLIASDNSQINDITAALRELGYQHRGDLGITGREAFFSPKNEDLPVHHLYVCREGCLALRNHLLLRDFLRKNETWRGRYGKLKIALVQKYPNDIDQYCRSKSDFIIELLKKCNMNQDDLATILKENMQ